MRLVSTKLIWKPKRVGESTYNPALLNELALMYEKDQEARFKVINSGRGGKDGRKN